MTETEEMTRIVSTVMRKNTNKFAPSSCTVCIDTGDRATSWSLIGIPTRHFGSYVSCASRPLHANHLHSLPTLCPPPSEIRDASCVTSHSLAGVANATVRT